MGITLVGSTGGTGSANGGTLTRTIPVTVLSGDLVVVAACQGTAVTGAFGGAASSSGGAFTLAISSVFQSSNIKFGIWYQYSTGQALTQVVTSGTGGSSDTTNSVVMVFRGVASSPLAATATTSNGSGTTPDSPSITPTVGSSEMPFALISAFAASIQDTAVTQPTSFALTGNANATDNRPSTTCAAWITYNSTAAINPTAWSGLTSATWVSVSVLLGTEAPDWVTRPPFSETDWRQYSIVGY